MTSWIVSVAAAAAALFGTSTAVAQSAVQIRAAASPNQAINMVILADGYTASELPDFAIHARQIADALLRYEPFATHRDMLNIYRVDIVSRESGLSVRGGARVDTALRSEQGCIGLDRSLCVDNALASAALARALPGVRADLRIVLANSDRYAGGGGFWASATSRNTLSVPIAIHEFGHSFAQLNDEFVEDVTCQNGMFGQPNEINATARTTRQAAPWAAWIAPSTPIPTTSQPGGEPVPGLYQGAHFCPNWHRPTDNSLMRTITGQFEQINSEHIVREIFARARPIAAAGPVAWPNASELSTTADGAIRFTAAPLVLPAALQAAPTPIIWRVNGALAGEGQEFFFDAAQFGPGVHTVTAASRVTSPFVRADPQGRLAQTRSWRVTVSAQPQGGVRLLAAVLPRARAVAFGQPATAFVTALNAGSGTATGCDVVPRFAFTGGYSWSETDPATNSPIGPANPIFTLGPGQARSFVIAYTPTAQSRVNQEQPLWVRCAGGATSEVQLPVNGFFLAAAASQPPDIIAISATPAPNPGILDLPASGGFTAFATAAVNIGAPGVAHVHPTTDDQLLPVEALICETEPASGRCLAAPAQSVAPSIATNETRTFSIFVRNVPGARIPFDPGSFRVTVRMTAPDGVQIYGATSVAVRTGS
jgi:hypothetical protein